MIEKNEKLIYEKDWCVYTVVRYNYGLGVLCDIINIDNHIIKLAKMYIVVFF